jgi:anhydro-N-acetylmuramic acid kinase
MTGTSMDGLDIVFCRVPAGEPGRFELLGATSEPFPPVLRAALLPGGDLTVAAAARAGRELGLWYAATTAALAARLQVAPDLVGVHGQTVYHEHGVTTVQIGEPSFLALRLGCPVVADFRAGDVAAGGCGAPLVPAVDAWLFGAPDRCSVALNLGGIANLTALVPTGDAVDVLGFDCGPANMVLDEFARRHSAGRRTCDADGALARRGRVRADLLEALLAEPWAARPPPRSLGREQFGGAYVDRLLGLAPPRSEADWCDLFATATELTVRAVADDLARYVAPRAAPTRLIVSGGGARNGFMMERLAAAVRPAAVLTSDALGVPSHLKEAIAFALLAAARIDGIPGNVPAVTGAHRPVLLGKIVEV